YPRETFSVPAVPNQRSVPGGPQLPSSPAAGVLNEADFRAIAASLAGAMPLMPQSPPVPGPASSSVDGGEGGPWPAPHQFPPATEMYSFPGVPAMPSSPPSAPPSGSDLAAVPSPAVAPGVPNPPTADSADGGRTDPWATAPHFA